MALVACRECKTQISTEAKICPKCGAKPPRRTSTFTWIVLGLVAYSVVTHFTDKVSSEIERTAKAKAVEQSRADADAVSFSRCKDQLADVLREVRAKADSKDFDGALALLAPCGDLNNRDILTEQNHISERKLLERVRTTPPAEVSTMMNSYAELVALVPTNNVYKSKLGYYTQRKAAEDAITAKEKAARAAKEADTIARHGRKPDFFEGEATVQVHLEKEANDPGSIELVGCTGAVPDKKLGWLIGCKYRGKNAYGGMILAAGMFVVSHGRVVDQLPLTTEQANQLEISR